MKESKFDAVRVVSLTKNSFFQSTVKSDLSTMEKLQSN